ncbi:MAG: glycosyltransferase family 39 protein [Chloroflexota bacterium]
MKRLFPVLLLLLLAAALRIHTLGEKAVWWDEAWSVWTAQQSFVQTTEITARDVHPPLYQWLLHGWVRIAGITEFAVRYLSVLWGLLAVATVYPLTLRLTKRNHRAALLAMFFIALSAFHIHWSQETRMYAMAAGAATLACYAYLRTDRRWSLWWVLLVIAGTTAALSHYLGAFILVILNLHWLLTIRYRPRAYHLRWIGAMIAAGLILLLWIAFAISRTRTGGGDANAQPAFIFQLAATLLAVGTSVNVDQYVWPTLIVMIGFFIGLALYARRDWRNGLLIFLMAGFPPLAIFLLSMPNRFYHPRPEERYLMIFAPVVYAGVGIALDRLRMLWRALGIAATIGLFGLYGYAYLRDLDARYMRDDYAMMLRTVNLLAKPDEPIFFVSGDRYPLVYYHLNRAANGYSALNAVGMPALGDNADGMISTIIGTNTRFWVIEIERSLGDPQNKAIPWLDTHFTRVLHIPIDYNGLTLYAASDKTSPTSDQILPPIIHEARPDDIVRIGMPPNQSVSLLHDNILIRTIQPMDTWQLAQFPIYHTYPPGDYSLQVGDSSYPFRITHSQPEPNPERNLNADFGEMKLLGYSLSTKSLHPGETLDLTLYWQVSSVPTENYTVFSHLLGPFNPATNGPLWTGQDSYPADTPTSALWVGQTIADHRRLTVPDNTPLGDYTFEVGLYRLETGQRLKRLDTTDPAPDNVVIAGIEVTR